MTISQGGWLLKFLQDVNKIFPIAECGIEDFKGAHYVVLSREFADVDGVCLYVWWKGHQWPIPLTRDELDHEDLTILLLQMKAGFEAPAAKMTFSQDRG